MTFIFYASLGNHLVRRENSPPILGGENGAIVSFLTIFFLRAKIKNDMEQSSITIVTVLNTLNGVAGFVCGEGTTMLG